MAHAIHHTPHYPAGTSTAPVLSSREISWTVALFLAWLGWPLARDFIIWILLKVYDLYITYVH